MNKQQIKRFAKYIVFKTKGQFHYEEDYWREHFSKFRALKIQKQIDVCMKDKNYQYFCDMLFIAFDQFFIRKDK